MAYSPEVNKMLVSAPIPDNASYTSYFGFTQTHLPELQAILKDEAVSDEIIREHVVWAISEFKDVDTLIEFAKKAYTREPVIRETRIALTAIGEPAIEPLANALEETAHNDYIGEVFANALIDVAYNDAEITKRIEPVLVKQLEKAETNGAGVNGVIIVHFKLHKLTQYLPLIEAAYNLNNVDQIYAGSWDDVQIAMGVKEPDPDQGKNSMQLLSSIADDFKKMARTERKAAADKKKKRKQSKESKKKNRKK